MSQISVTMTANDRDLLASFTKQQAALDKQIRKYDELERKTKEADRAAKKAADNAPINQQIASLKTLATGWISATAAISAYMAANRQSMQETALAATSLDAQQRRTALLMRTRGAQAENANKVIEETALANGIDPKIAHQISQQMAGSGFENKEITGGALDAFIKLRAASGEDPNSPVAPEQLQAMSRYFASQGIDKSAGNITKYGSKIQALFGPTDLSFGNLQDLAKVASGFKGVMSPEEQLAAFSSLVGVMPGAEAGTKLADITKNFRVAGSKKDATEQLGKIGLKPEDVDFVGENLGEVIDRMKAGLGSIPEAQRATVMAKVLEGANIATFEHLMANRKQIYDLIPQMDSGEKQFAADVRLMQGGRAFQNRQLDAAEQQQLAGRASNYGEVSKAMKLTMREQGFSPFSIWAREQAFNAMSGLGMSAEMALGAVAGSSTVAPGVISGTMDRASGYDPRRSEDLDAQLEAMRNNTDAVKKNSEILLQRGLPGLGGQKEPGANE